MPLRFFCLLIVPPLSCVLFLCSIEKSIRLGVFESLCRILDFLITPQAYQQRFNTMLKRDDTRHGCRVGVGCVSLQIHFSGVIRKTYIRNSENTPNLIHIFRQSIIIENARQRQADAPKQRRGRPSDDPFKNQVLNYFTVAYMKYLNPSGLAKKPSILSLHIKISV